MLEWVLISMVLLVVSTVYCARNVIADFRNAKASAGIWGAVALAGTLSPLTLGLTALLFSIYYH
jgi:hypothetical protein